MNSESFYSLLEKAGSWSAVDQLNILSYIKKSFKNTKTTNQILNAPLNSIYIWHNHDVSYPVALARSLGRSDLTFKGASWLTTSHWRGLKISGITIDHNCYLNDKEILALNDILTVISWK